MNKGIKAGIVISDIRNFTGTFAHFEKTQNDIFMNEFLNMFYDVHVRLAETITKNFWYNSLGDSMIFIFMGKNHSKNAYAFSIALHRYLMKMCEDFNDIHDTDISFGIGIECGNVWKREIRNRDGSIHTTYVGNTINMVKRIESQTKIFGETQLLVGGNIYDYLMQDLYTSEYANARLFKTNYIEILKSKPSLVLMSENIMLYYIFKLKLPGIEIPLPLFRYDNDLSSDDGIFWNVMSKLVEEKSKDLLINLLK